MRPTSPRMVMFVLLTTLGLVGSLAGPATAADWTVEPAANSFGADRQEYRHTLNPGGRLEDGMVDRQPGRGAASTRLEGRGATGCTWTGTT